MSLKVSGFVCGRKNQRLRLEKEQYFVVFNKERCKWRKEGMYLYRLDRASWKKRSEELVTTRVCITCACGCFWWEW